MTVEERRRAYQREFKRQWRADNPEQLRTYKRALYHATPTAQKRDKHLRKTFDISLSEYEIKLAAQGGVCAICRQPETVKRNGVVKPLAVDHYHTTDTVRGLLCQRCNQGLGNFKEDKTRLTAAIAYLDRHSNKP